MRRSAAGVVLIVMLAVAFATVWLVGRKVITLGGRTAPGPVRRVGQTMPDFELLDLQGRTWRLADLKGKIAFINVWATWCGPCCSELPHLQRLYDGVKERRDVVLLTMNVDEKASEVEPFMRRNGYTFPVIPAYDYVRKTLATVGIPRNWVIDQNGVWRFDEIGYREGDGDWVANAQRMIEDTRATRGSSGPAS
jgi:peroxiredoxin